MRHGKMRYLHAFLFFSVLLLRPNTAMGETYALFIGTTEYEHANDLPFAENNAKDMFVRFVAHKVVKTQNAAYLVGNNTKEEVERLIKDKFPQMKEGDTLIVFNSSHGGADGRMAVSNGSISGEEMSGWISERPCSEVVFMNHSCHSGAMVLDIPDKKVSQLPSSSGEEVSYTSLAETPSTGHINSVGVKFWLDSFDNPEADRNKDGDINLYEMYQHAMRGTAIYENETVKKMTAEALGQYKGMTDLDLITACDEALLNYKQAKQNGDLEAASRFWNEYFKTRIAADSYVYNKDVTRDYSQMQPPFIGNRNFRMSKRWAEDRASTQRQTAAVPEEKASGEHRYDKNIEDLKNRMAKILSEAPALKKQNKEK